MCPIGRPEWCGTTASIACAAKEAVQGHVWVFPRPKTVRPLPSEGGEAQGGAFGVMTQNAKMLDAGSHRSPAS